MNVSEEVNNIIHDFVKYILQRSNLICQKKIHFFLDCKKSFIEKNHEKSREKILVVGGKKKNILR